MKAKSITVEEFTTPNPVTVSEHTSVNELTNIMFENGFRHIPVVSEDKVVGIISERDLKVLSFLNQEEISKIRACDIMAKDPVSISSQTPIDEAAMEMSKLKIGSLMIYDQENNFLGVFTVTDALNALIEISRGSV